MFSSSKEAVIVVVISFLAVILIYSSVAKFDAFARSKIESGGCTQRDPTKPGATSAKECCWTVTNYDKSGRITDVYSLCQTCEYDSNGNKIDCRNTSSSRNTGLGNTLPPSAGFAQPPSTPPPPPPSNALPPSSSLPSTCPDGSAPDANGNCATSSSFPPPPPPNQTPPPVLGGIKHPTPGGNNIGQTTSSSCPDGSQPDSNGNCPNTLQRQAPMSTPSPPPVSDSGNSGNTVSHHHHNGGTGGGGGTTANAEGGSGGGGGGGTSNTSPPSKSTKTKNNGGSNPG